MGVYVYRVTAKKVICSDGKPANVAIFAYKPSWNFFDGDKLNRRWAFQSGCYSSERMAEAGRLTDRIVVGDRDKSVEPGSRVYQNVRNMGTFYDDSDLGSERLPRIDGITAG